MTFQLHPRARAITRAAALAAALAVAGCASPFPDFDPVAWQPGPDAPLTQDLALSEARAIAAPALRGPEDIVIDSRGYLYTGTNDGVLWRADLHDAEPRLMPFATVGGRPLGLVVDADDTVYIANHGIGLQSVDRDGRLRLVLAEAGGTPIRFANDLAIDADGVLNLSDSSSRYNVTTIGVRATYVLPDLLDGRPSGRVIRHDPKTAATTVLADGLYFPNGIALTRDGGAIIVAETNRNRLTRIALPAPGEPAAKPEVLVDNLPGFADGLTGLGDGRILLAAYERSRFLDRFILPNRLTRSLFARLPDSFFARSIPRGYVAVVDDRSGRIEQALGDDSGRLPPPANAVVWRGELFMGTLNGGQVSRVAVKLE